MADAASGQVASTAVLPHVPVAGLARLPAAVDTQPGFLQAMLRRIAARPELGGLTTREPDDPSIGLLDAAATMLDVLAFYGDLLTNEGFIRTATERRSVLELARAIGYELAPGVAASTVLAFNVDPPPGADPVVRIPKGLQAQKLPGDDGAVAVYETSEELLARKELNELRLRRAEPVTPHFGEQVLYFHGIGLGVSVGDAILVIGGVVDKAFVWDMRRVVSLKEVPAEVGLGADGAPARTELRLDLPPSHANPHIDLDALHPSYFLLTTSGTLFGANAPRWSDLPLSLRVGERDLDGEVIKGPYAGMENEWVDQPLPKDTTDLWLDRIHTEITGGSFLVLTRPSYSQLCFVTEVTHTNHNAFLMSGPSTKISILPSISDVASSNFSIRSTVVLAASRELPIGTRPVSEAVTGSVLVVDTQVKPERGRRLVITGIDADTGAAASEEVVVDASGHAPSATAGHGTTILLQTALMHRYQPTGFRIRANTALATHGQTIRSHPIGSGDASRPFLTIPLAVGDAGNRPLTYTSSDTPTGRTSSLELRVDGVLWSEVESLYGQPPEAQVYVVRHGEGSTATVQFGDGRMAARPGSGRDNIVATFRMGVGAAGSAARGQISLPLGLPLGLRDVVNPVPALGGEDPEALDQARVNAPTTVRTLDRVVSLADHEDFTRAFAGIGWASASAVDDGERAIVHVTATLADGTPLPPDSALKAKLTSALTRARHVDRPLVVAGHLPRPVEVQASLRLDPRHVREDVLAAAHVAVLKLFDRSPSLGVGGGFGKLITPTRVLAALQHTAGVLGAVLKVLRPTDESGPVVEVLARPARPYGGSILAAELLEPKSVTITEVAS